MSRSASGDGGALCGVGGSGGLGGSVGVAGCGGGGRFDVGAACDVASTATVPGTARLERARTKRFGCTNATRSAALTVDMSPALMLEHVRGQPALCMTGNRSLGQVWRNVQDQVLVQVQVPGLVWFLGFEGRGYVAPRSGVWVLEGDARTETCPENLDDVGVVWEHKSGYETACTTRKARLSMLIHMWAWSSSATG